MDFTKLDSMYGQFKAAVELAETTLPKTVTWKYTELAQQWQERLDEAMSVMLGKINAKVNRD